MDRTKRGKCHECYSNSQSDLSLAAWWWRMQFCASENRFKINRPMGRSVGINFMHQQRYNRSETCQNDFPLLLFSFTVKTFDIAESRVSQVGNWKPPGVLNFASPKIKVSNFVCNFFSPENKLDVFPSSPRSNLKGLCELKSVSFIWSGLKCLKHVSEWFSSSPPALAVSCRGWMSV